MRRIADRMDDLVETLTQLVAVMQAREGMTSTQSTDDGTSHVHWFSSGVERVPLEDDEGMVYSGKNWKKITFPFRAKSINVRTTDDVDAIPVHPIKGGANPTRIRPGDNESPFSVGGDSGIDTRAIWLRAADTAGGTPNIEVFAFA